MSLFPTTPDYTDKDFAALVARLDHLIAAAFPNWTETARANFGNILKESNAFTTDVSTFYQDQQARECRWGTATQRYAMIALGRLISYELDGAEAATVEFTFSIPSALTADVTIPAGTRVKTAELNEPVYFTLLADVTISAGDVSETGDAEHSEEFTDPFTAKGERDEEFVLSQTPFLDESDELVIGLDTWTRVDNFLNSGATDQHYIVLVDQNDQATLRTGDGTNGAIPTPSADVAATYKTGGGEEGNVEAGTLTKLVGGPFYDDLGNPVSLSVTNASAASGGTKRETVAQARVRAPASLRVLNRAIARQDFEDLAIQLSSVARALMLTKNEDATIPEGRGYLYVVPVGGGSPTETLRNTIQSYINDNFPPPLNFSWEVRSTTDYKTVSVVSTVYLTQDATEAAVTTAVREALSAFFAPLDEEDEVPNTLINFGYYYTAADGTPDPKVPLSTVKNLVHDATGIRRLGTPADGEGLELNGAEDDVDLIVREFPEAGNLTLVNGDTASTFYSGTIN